MPSLLRSFAVFAVVSAVAVLSMPGCSQQGEGQRCDPNKNGDADCESGLVCVSKGTLRDETADGRCCAADGSSTDSRCDLKTTSSNSGGSGGSGGTGNAAGESVGGNSAAGADSVGGGAAGSPVSSEGGTGSSGAPASAGDGGVAGAVPAAAGAGAGGAP
jgi:hypothetical protein